MTHFCIGAMSYRHIRVEPQMVKAEVFSLMQIFVLVCWLVVIVWKASLKNWHKVLML